MSRLMRPEVFMDVFRCVFPAEIAVCGIERFLAGYKQEITFTQLQEAVCVYLSADDQAQRQWIQAA
eukprot:m.130989 g.130989  ORF g.130989 m.130989 type:complete len:66 (+) comp9463_c0_seq2:923-1120(+)